MNAMASTLFSSRLRILVLAMFTFIIFVDIYAAVYHLTGGGIPSGITESILAFVLALSWYLIYTAQRFEPASKKYNLLRWTSLFLIFSTAVVLLCFGIYHFGTPTGVRSGVTETSLAFFLIVLNALLYVAYKRPTGT